MLLGPPKWKAAKMAPGSVFRPFWTGNLVASRIRFFGCSWGTLHGKPKNDTRGTFYGILDGKPGGLQNPVFGVLLGAPTRKAEK